MPSTASCFKTVFSFSSPVASVWKYFLLFCFPGQSHEPPTPPTTPKTDPHPGNRHDAHQHADSSTGSAPPTTRQNIDFNNMDMSELSTDVIGNMDGFDVHEFDQYLPPNSLGSSLPTPTDSSHTHITPSRSFTPPSIHPHSHSVPTWTSKTSSGTPTGVSPPCSSRDNHVLHEDTGRKPQIKTEQMSPSHYSSSPSFTPPPPQLEYTSLISGTCPFSPSSSSVSPSDYTDLQSPSFYSAFSGYPASLYQYFHSSRRPYATPLINSLALAPSPHSPPPGWEQPSYTTLTRP